MLERGMLRSCLIAAALTFVSGNAFAAARRPLLVDVAQSRIEVAVRATMDSFTAKLGAFEPVIEVDESGDVTAAQVRFHFRDVATGKAKRDAAMHTWQQTDTFPDGVFDLEAVEKHGDTLTAVGRLTFHGVAHPLRFPISIARDGRTYAIDGDATIDTREYQLPIIRMMGLLKVDPLVHVRFHVQAADQASAPRKP